MKFKDSLLYEVIMTPINAAESYCLYSWLLALPYWIVTYVVGIPLAIVIDCWRAIDGAE